MWYWVCQTEKDNNGKYTEICFNCLECYSSKIYANLILFIKKLKTDKFTHWFIREDSEHCNRDYPQYDCPNCGNLMSKKEIDKTWDWAGPHCNNCGCTGMEMFAHVSRFKPIISGRAFINVCNDIVKRLKE